MKWPLLFCTFCVLRSSLAYGPADYKVTGLGKYGADPTDELYSGYMPLKLGDTNEEGSYFFWLAKQRNIRTKPERLVVWLNGGPGCSSMVGMWFEHGPYTVEAGAGFTEFPTYPTTPTPLDKIPSTSTDGDDNQDETTTPQFEIGGHHHKKYHADPTFHPTHAPKPTHRPTADPRITKTYRPTDEEPGKPPKQAPIDTPPPTGERKKEKKQHTWTMLNINS